MTAFLARIFLTIALLAQGVGAIAAEIGVALHPHCHMGSNEHGKPAKMPCCHCDECTVPACATGCPVQGAMFIVPLSWPSIVVIVASPLLRAAPVEVRSLDPSPPLRPPIA